jgi:hypothetical protein
VAPPGDRQTRIGFGAVSYVARPGAPGVPGLEQQLSENVYENRRRSLLPDELLALGARVNAIVGYAHTSANAAIPFAQVWLRNVRTGEIEARAVADEFGRFVFLDIHPTGYVVELIGPDGMVIAASPFVSVGYGDVRQTAVFVTIGGPRRMTAAAAAAASQTIDTAVNAGVSRVGQPERAVSPQR